jgi:hypothetical protein
MGSLIWNSLWLITVDPHRGGSISLRPIKYTWLPFSAYAYLNALSEALETILSQVGSEYQITFA